MSKEVKKHNHSCTCDHENVTYCKTCKLVHCQDCKTEWSTKPTYWYGYGYPNTWLGNYPSTQFLGSAAGGSIPGNTLQAGYAGIQNSLTRSTHKSENVLNDGHTVTVSDSTCKHGA